MATMAANVPGDEDLGHEQGRRAHRVADSDDRAGRTGQDR